MTTPARPELALEKHVAPPVLSAPLNASCAACTQLAFGPFAAICATIPFPAGGNRPP